MAIRVREHRRRHCELRARLDGLHVSAPVLATTSTTTDGGDGQAKAMVTGQISMRLPVVSDAVVPLSQTLLNAVICFQGDSDRVFSNAPF